MTLRFKSFALACGVASLICSSTFAADQAQHKKVQKPVQKTKKIVEAPSSLENVKTAISFYSLPDIAIGRPVYTAPFMGGINSRYDESNLVVHINDINRDLILLQQRQKADDALKAHHLTEPKDPIMSLSGEIQGKILADRDYNGPTESDIDLSTAKLDAIINIRPWVTGFMTLNYDNTASSNGARINNSRLYLENGFVTLGNLNRTPFYMSVGQLYVPFGQYNSSLIATPLTQSIGETNERAMVFGFKNTGENTLNVTAYVGKGDIRVGDENANKINQVGANAIFAHEGKNFTYQLGAGYIGNIADAAGMQTTGGKGSFTGFGQGAASNEVITDRVPGVDVQGMIGYGPFSFVGEYTGAAKRFSPLDMTYDAVGARPRAYHLEGAYQFDLIGHQSSFALAYGHSYQALALNLPNSRYAATFSSNIVANTVFSMELRHDENYAEGKIATGQGQSTFDTTDLGKSANAATAEISLYF